MKVPQIPALPQLLPTAQETLLPLLLMEGAAAAVSEAEAVALEEVPPAEVLLQVEAVLRAEAGVKQAGELVFDRTDF